MCYRSGCPGGRDSIQVDLVRTYCPACRAFSYGSTLYTPKGETDACRRGEHQFLDERGRPMDVRESRDGSRRTTLYCFDCGILTFEHADKEGAVRTEQVYEPNTPHARSA
jgi:hypothetical protein